jgi:hypothetical protein
MFAERKDAVEMALGVALLVISLRWQWRTKEITTWIEEVLIGVLTFVAVLLIFLGTW